MCRSYRSIAWGIAGIMCLAACSPQNGDLPTLAAVPTQPASPLAAAGTLEVPPTRAETLIATVTATITPLPSATASGTPAASATPTFTPSATITETPTPTFTPEPTLPPQDRPLTGLLELAASTTLLPGDFAVPAYEGITILLSPTADPNAFVPFGTVIAPAGGVPLTGIIAPVNCAYYPPAGFGVVYANAPDLAVQLGCPASNPPDILSVSSAWQPFQNGLMVWLSGDIYVLYSSGSYQYVADTFVAGRDAETLSDVPPVGLQVPVRGFAKVWSQTAGVKSGLGWALSGEVGVPASVLPMQNGLIAALQGRSDTLILVGGRTTGLWRSVLGGHNSR